MDVTNYDFESKLEQGFKSLFKTAGINLYIADDVDGELPDENVRLELSVGGAISDEHLSAGNYDNYGGSIDINIQTPRVSGDQVAEKTFQPLDISGASAAYSLRNLSSSYTGNVVEVRRSPDDQVRSFTAAEVTDGTLLAWVNADVDKLDLQAGSLDPFITNETATGFDFSVNNEGANYKFKSLLPLANVTTGTYTATFDVVLNSGSLSETIIRSGNPAEEAVLVAGANSFTCTPSGIAGIYFRTANTAVADVSITNITLTQTTADGHVSTWYDQSGNDNHATQATTTSQPKIVDAGSLVAGGIDFDGVDDWIRATGAGAFKSSDGLGFFSVYNKRNASTSDSFTSTNPQYLVQVRGVNFSTTTFAARILGGEMNTIRAHEAGAGTFYTTKAATHTIGTDRTLSSVTGAQSVDLYNDGSELTLSIDESGLTYAVPDATILVGTQDGGTRFFDGTLSEIIIYNSDQSANRLRYEYDIAKYYGIKLGPYIYQGDVLFNSRHAELVAIARKTMEEMLAAVLTANWPNALSPTKITPTGTERDNDAESRSTTLSYSLQFRIT